MAVMGPVPLLGLLSSVCIVPSAVFCMSGSVKLSGVYLPSMSLIAATRRLSVSCLKGAE